MLFQTNAIKDAVLSECGLYRYRLTRVWDNLPLIGFCMLNPSTADAVEDDPTIRRCIGFAKSWGGGGIVVVNLFAYRATDPAELCRVADPVGPENDDYIYRAARECSSLVAAWGVRGQLNGRDRVVLDMLAGKLVCLGETKDGYPKHPLYLPSGAKITGCACT